MEADVEAQLKWTAVVRESAKFDMNYLASCTPGYYTGQGDFSRGFFNDLYRGSEVEFWAMIDEWFDSGDMSGMKVV